jgi:hypothetical protein
VRTGTSPQAGSASGNQDRKAGAVVVIGYVHSGGALFRKAIEGPGGPPWLDAQGLVHTVYQLGTLWERIDGRASGMSTVSPLTRKGIRTLLQTMLLGRLAQDGAKAWLASATPHPLAALEFFAEIYGEAKFVCLHRGFDDFATAVTSAYRWGIAGNGTGLDNFVMQHPWSPAAALAQYWAAQTETLLSFERSFPGRCLRVHHHDLVSRPDDVLARFRAFTGWELRPWPAGLDDEADGASASPDSASPALVPRDKIPGDLLDQVTRLMGELGY